MRRWIIIALVVCLAAFGGYRYAVTRWSHWEPSRDDYPMQGISVSEAQGSINWGSLEAQNVDFAYIRASDGVQRDPLFAFNWRSARGSGLRYGAELKFDLCKPAADQATMFITTVPRDSAALPPAVTLGFDDRCPDHPERNYVLSALNTLLNLIENHSGKPAVVRVSEAFNAAYQIDEGINRTFWAERSYFAPSYLAHPWVMWTASRARQLEGIDGPVDWNVVPK